MKKGDSDCFKAWSLFFTWDHKISSPYHICSPILSPLAMNSQCKRYRLSAVSLVPSVSSSYKTWENTVRIRRICKTVKSGRSVLKYSFFCRVHNLLARLFTCRKPTWRLILGNCLQFWAGKKLIKYFLGWESTNFSINNLHVCASSTFLYSQAKFSFANFLHVL